MIKRITLIAIFGIVTGIIASLASVLFVEIVDYLSNLFFTSETPDGSPIFSWAVISVILVPALGGLAVGLLCNWNSEKRPLTLVDTIKTTQTMEYVSPLKSGLTTAMASIVALGTGVSVGQYGPLAHLGATLGNWVSRMTGSSGFTGTMGIGCGAAAAIATAFNAPIAGMLFAHEVVLRHYSLRSFAPISVAAATGFIFANYIFPHPSLFQLHIINPVLTYEYLIFILLGVAGAYVATLFIRAVLCAKALADKLHMPSFCKPGLAGLILGIVAIWLPEVLSVSESGLRDSVVGSVYSNSYMLIILVAKLGLTAMCLGFGFAGGIFSPALVIGLLFGAIIGNLAPYLIGDPHSVVAVYAICGMVAVTSPVIGAPLTAILIVFELTRNYELTIAAMVSVAFANLVGCQLLGRSIFDVQLKNQGVDLSLGRDKVVLDSRAISDYLSQDFVVASSDDVLSELRDKLISADRSEGYILNSNKEYLGTIDTVKLLTLEQQGISLGEKCGNHMTREQLVLTPDITIWSAIDKIQDFVGESIPVVSSGEKEVFLGVVYEASVARAYMDTLSSIRQDEHGVT